MSISVCCAWRGVMAKPVAVADRVDLAPAVHLHLDAVDTARGVVVEAEEVAGAEAAEVDGLAELVVERRGVGAAEAAGGEDGVERVAFFEREDDGVLGKRRGSGRGQLSVVKRRDDHRRARNGHRHRLRDRGVVGDGGEDEGDCERKRYGDIQPRPPGQSSQKSLACELSSHRFGTGSVDESAGSYHVRHPSLHPSGFSRLVDQVRSGDAPDPANPLIH